MDNNDIIIALSEYIKKQENEFTLNFQEVEADIFIPQDSISEQLETAADEAGFEVVRKGKTSASLRKRPRQPTRLVRS